MIEINLIPDVKQELIKAKRTRNRVITISIMAGVISIVLVIVLVIFVFIAQAATGSYYDGQINEYNNKISKISDISKTLTIQNQLSKINDINSNKKITSRLFDLLSKTIPAAPNDIQISDLTIDTSADKITINGQAANSYAALEVFKKMITGAEITYKDEDGNSRTEPLASDVSTSDISYGEEASGNKVLRFTVSFVYAQAMFSPDVSNLLIKIANTGDVTDSYLGLPNTIFADQATDITGEN